MQARMDRGPKEHQCPARHSPTHLQSWVPTVNANMDREQWPARHSPTHLQSRILTVTTDLQAGSQLCAESQRFGTECLALHACGHDLVARRAVEAVCQTSG